MKARYWGLVAVVALLFFPGTVQAVCGGSIVPLNGTNTGAIDVTVNLCVVVSGSTITVSVDSVTNAANYGGVNFINEFAYTPNTASFVSGSPGNWGLKGCVPGCNISTFGSFAIAAQLSPNIQPPSPTWTLNGTAPTFYAVHLAFNNGCTGFWSNAPGGNTTAGTSGPCTPIPEPASMALLGTGLLGIAGVVRRRLFSKG